METNQFPKKYNGRVIKSRHFGKLLFLDILCGDKIVQGILTKDSLKDRFPTKKQIQKGDIVGIGGVKSDSEERELSVEVKEINILSKNNTKDLIESTADNLKSRSELTYNLRSFLRGEDYVEVDLPVIQEGDTPSKSRSFSTSHVTIGEDLTLRKSMDIFLRRIALRGLDKIYSIGPNFRNEYISKDKIPEFNMLSLISNYAGVEDLIDLSKRLISFVISQSDKEEILCSKEIKTIDYNEFVSPFSNTEHPYTEAKANMKKPVIIYGLPSHSNSIAKQKNANTLDEFKLIIRGYTVVHGYSDLNDAKILKEKLSKQKGFVNSGELESLLNEMEMGCPPSSSMGLSLDRLSMLICGTKNIRDAMAFPFSRIEKHNG